MSDPENKNNIDISPDALMSAVWKLPYGSSPDMSHHAEGIRLITKMIKAGADPSQLAVPGHFENQSPTTPVIVAAASDDAICLALLLSSPLANPDFIDEDGDTALIVAAFHGNPKCVEILAPICDPNAQDREGRNALVCAMLHGDAESVAILAPITDLRALNADGATARQVAQGHRQALRYIPLLDSILESQILEEAIPSANEGPAGRPTRPRSL